MNTLIAKYKPFLIGAVIVALILFPLVITNNYLVRVGISVLLYILLASSLNVINGYSGQFNIGQAGFYCVGAYTAGILATKVGMSFWPLLVISGVVAALFGCCLGLPTMRLKGVYLAITTLGFSEIIRLVVLNWTDLTRGPMGIPGIPFPVLCGWQLKTNTHFYYIILVLVAVMIWMTSRVLNSRIGRAWIAIREDESAARSMGVETFNYKLLNLVYGTFWAGVAGCFYAFFASYISADSFTLDEGFIILSMILVGGQGTLLGPVVGASVLTIIPEIFRFAAQYRLVIYGLAILVIMYIKPQGLAGSGMLSRRYQSAKNKDSKGTKHNPTSTAGEVG
jgi:branched-chain amino acid transport system permease protein